MSAQVKKYTFIGTSMINGDSVIESTKKYKTTVTIYNVGKKTSATVVFQSGEVYRYEEYIPKEIGSEPHRGKFTLYYFNDTETEEKIGLMIYDDILHWGGAIIYENEDTLHLYKTLVRSY
ncbi:hypothetical protein QLS31_04200 [Flavobacterium sp. XS2P24]|uniref:hypothetical protein n=1 Tax=Flavobacterium sp. XS2P24 TaxID=3041249 RepID=UPI0024A8F07F|nr:hypothetical protein [Flavobacterium sp. XS2P24]MDI6049024.1 hypothetical protein [Flavobacterium sp. XS2P24]